MFISLIKVYFCLSIKNVSFKLISDFHSVFITGASKLASTYFTLFYRSVHVLYTGMLISLIKVYFCLSIKNVSFKLISDFHSVFITNV